jgi:DNA (cytosine-5)-methyltransferase 1
LRIASLFSGCGGLDLGFTRLGFTLVYANDNDPKIWETFERNHKIPIDRRSLFDITSEEIPDADGIIGGPPCQSWSLAGAMRGGRDERGRLFYEYVRVLRDKRPKFFLAENVPGILSSTHIREFKLIIRKLSDLGYDIDYSVVDARDYGVPQERRRVIIVGYRESLGLHFGMPPPTHSRFGGIALDGRKTHKWVTLRQEIGDLPGAIPARDKNRANESLVMPNHEYMNGGFSSIYMSRNRKKNWDDQSYTIQAGGRHAPLHPSSTEMVKIGEDEWTFKSSDPIFRRLSVRECARIQTFPDDFIFYYENVADGYKMVGNAVPVKLAETIAGKIACDLRLMRGQEDARLESTGTIRDP